MHVYLGTSIYGNKHLFDMKKHVAILVLLFFFHTSFAQINFEGVIKWKMELLDKNGKPVTGKEISPEEQAELAESIKELENQLKDPETKAMLDANPEMKKMLENQLLSMKAMQGTGSGSTALMPTSYTMKIKDGSTYTSFEGGAMAAMGDMLYVKSSNITYFINNTKKTYSTLPKETETSKDSAVIKVTPTTLTKKILNYNCTKYIVTITENKKTQTMIIWATKDLKQYSSSSFSTMNGHSNKSTAAAWNKIDGVPLRIETTEEGQSMVIEMTELKYTVLPASTFIVPANYKSVPFGQ
jgi:hypothetical protein